MSELWDETVGRSAVESAAAPAVEPVTGPARRTVLCAVAGVAGLGGMVAVTGCAGGSGARGAEPDAALVGKEVAKAADVPVGGGKVIEQYKIVVTQPSAGVYKAFSSTCTHAGCQVRRVAGGLINCPCHGSDFRVTDGGVAKGPASRALLEYPVELRGDGLVIG